MYLQVDILITCLQVNNLYSIHSIQVPNIENVKKKMQSGLDKLHDFVVNLCVVFKFMVKEPPQIDCECQQIICLYSSEIVLY